jgi:hypothetical protein
LSHLSELAAPLAVGAVWLVAAGICYPRGTVALIGCAPVAIVLSWTFWLQAQGWPVGDGKFVDLGFFTLAVLIGSAGGASLRPILRACGTCMRPSSAAKPKSRVPEINYLAASMKGEGVPARARAARAIRWRAANQFSAAA